MKKRERSVEVSDLDAVARFGDSLVLYIDGEDDNTPTTLCVRANFDSHRFDPVQPISVYLATQHYKAIDDGDTQLSYRHRILEEMDTEVIDDMLRDFTQQHFHKQEVQG